MKTPFYVLILSIFLGCNGAQISEEQRQSIREEMKRREIRQIPRSEITQAVFENGKSLAGTIKSQLMAPKYSADSMNVQQFCDSVASANVLIHKVFWTDENIQPDDDLLMEKEKALVDAFEQMPSDNMQSMEDNVQKLEGQQWAYTFMVDLGKRKGMVLMRLDEKEIIRSMY